MKELILFVVSLLLGFVLLPIMFLYSMIFGKKQEYVLLKFAINIDILGNINGDMIRDLVIINKSKPNLFCASGVTISASLGHLIATDNINNFGLWFSNILDKAFQEKNHCLNAFNLLNLDSQKTN